MKPIEAGCMAVVIKAEFNPSNVGKVVKVVRKLSLTDISAWVAEGDVLRGRNGQGGHGWATFLEQHLMRIDGEDFSGEENTIKITISL